MKHIFPATIAVAGWFAVVTQFVLMINNATVPTSESVVRFFSYFTILTNTLVSFYFTYRLLTKTPNPRGLFNAPGTLTAVTVYITVVGLVYQVVLRHTWSPEGMQKVVDELLHTLVPALVIVYWATRPQHAGFNWDSLRRFLIYPIAYLFFILIRGHFSDFYPYPFVEVNVLGWPQTLTNIASLVAVFLVLYLLFTFVGRFLTRKKE